MSVVFSSDLVVYGNKIGGAALSLAAVNSHPARSNQHLAFGLEVLPRRLGNTGGHTELGGGKEHRQEALGHQVVDLACGIAQFAGDLQCGNNGEVIRYLFVVENASIRLDPLLLAYRVGEGDRKSTRLNSSH